MYFIKFLWLIKLTTFYFSNHNAKIIYFFQSIFIVCFTDGRRCFTKVRHRYEISEDMIGELAKEACCPSATIFTNMEVGTDCFKVQTLKEVGREILDAVGKHHRVLMRKFRQARVGENVKILRSYADEHRWRCDNNNTEIAIFETIKLSYPL